MNKHKQHDLTPIPPSEEDMWDDDLLDTMRSMQESMQIPPSHLSHITELYLTNDIDTLVQTVEDLADTMMVEDSFYQKLIADRKKNPRKDQEIVDQIRELHTTYMEYIYLEANIPNQGFEAEMDAASAHIDTLLSDPTDQRAAYAELGITKPSPDGRTVTYHFPSEIVPPAVNNKWEAYIGAVLRHLESVEKLPQTGDKDDVKLKDSIRYNAHNAVTHDIERLIGSKIGLDFAATRMLLATIREQELASLGTQRERQQVRTHAQERAKRQHGLLRAVELLLADHPVH